MRVRKISPGQVETCIRDPHRTAPSRESHEDRTIFERQISQQRRLKVVGKEYDDSVRVITAFWMKP
jgi:hypothetical protein